MDFSGVPNSGVNNISFFDFFKNSVCNFAYEESFDNKRFSRYVQRVEDVLNKNIQTVFDNHNIPNNIFKKFTWAVLYAYYFPDSTYGEVVNSTLKALRPISRVQMEDAEIFLKEFFEKDLSYCGLYSLESIINENLRWSCKKHIAKISNFCSCSQEDYFFTLPEANEDIFEIILDVLNGCISDINNLYCNNISKEMIHSIISKSNDNLNNRLTNQDILIKEQKDIILELNTQVDKLNVQINEKEEEYKKNLVKEKQALIESCKKAEREKTKLEKNYTSLKIKYEKLKNSNEQIVDSPKKESIIDKTEVDMYGKYGFAVFGDALFNNDLIKAFPNSVIIGENTVIPQDLSLVICISSHVSHTSYYNVKEKCKLRGIPFIHCTHTNIQLIKNIILERYPNNT